MKRVLFFGWMLCAGCGAPDVTSEEPTAVTSSEEAPETPSNLAAPEGEEPKLKVLHRVTPQFPAAARAAGKRVRWTVAFAWS